MKITGNTYRLLFAGFVVSVIAVFFSIRPLNSPWHRFISGDGLGYYAYLPAQFIYNDTQLQYKWFAPVYKKYYPQGTFENPEDNFLVTQGNKHINKYYPGLSVVWLPFFALAHLLAPVCNQPADGYSAPYQLAMALASLFYLLVGLFFLRRLILLLGFGEAAALLSPMFLFYGSHLFNYALNYNTLSHVYSFSFVVLFLYFATLVFHATRTQGLFVLLCLLCYVITVGIRPLNALVLLLLPGIGFNTAALRQVNGWFKPMALAVALLSLAVLMYLMRIQYLQTGALWSYTYGKEGFRFADNRFLESLFSYHLGLFVYAPLMLPALAGVLCARGRLKYTWLPVFMVFAFLYASWWYWPIVKRALIDYYVIPAVLLAALISRTEGRRRWWLVTVLCVCAGYYQFKELQIQRGILDEFTTYRDVFWRNFFRTHKTNMYLVPPASVIAENSHTESYEEAGRFPRSSAQRARSGKMALLIDNGSAPLVQQALPEMLKQPGRKKVRVGFWCWFEKGMGPVHVFLRVYNQANQLVREEPFYLSGEDLLEEEWDYKEFGCELEGDLTGRVECLLWNTIGGRALYVDDLKLEFFLCNNRFETPLE